MADVLDVRVADDIQIDTTAALLGGLSASAPTVDRDDRRLAITTSTGVSTLVAAARALDDAGVGLLDLGLRRPSLDDVFLALTDTTTDHEPIHVPRHAARAMPEPGARALPRRRPLRDMAAVTGRYLRRFVRTPNVFIFGAVQPVAFIVGLDAVFGGIVEQFSGATTSNICFPASS